MNLAPQIVLGIIALLHTYFFVLESVLWGKPRTNKVFGIDAATAAISATLAKNQGVYNLFLAAGLVWAIVHPSAEAGREIGVFFCSCVIIAGIVGAVTANKRILFIQALPAVIGLGLLLKG
jgi:putative membrane protein